VSPLYKTMIGTAGLGAVLLVMSAVFTNDEHGFKWVLGGIGWFGFMICVLALILLALVALGRSVLRRTSDAA
jgi:hypothetical protein